MLPLVGGKNKKKVGKLLLQVKISKFHEDLYNFREKIFGHVGAKK